MAHSNDGDDKSENNPTAAQPAAVRPFERLGEGAPVDLRSASEGRATPAPYGIAMTDAPRRGPEKGLLLNDEEIKIWEAADRGTDDTNPEWCALH